MIPCYICKKDSIGGFSYGLPTTPDSMHVGLCPEHNTLENKKAAILHWIESTQASVSALNERNMARYAKPVEYTLTVFYAAGGTISISCTAWDIPDGVTLQVSCLAGGVTFIPLSHIERFEVAPALDPTPYTTAEANTKRYEIVDGVPKLAS